MGEGKTERLILRDLPLPIRLVLATFLMSVGLGYLSALVQLHFQQASPGEPLPGPKEVIDNYHGRSGMGQLERLITANENKPFNGSGSMHAAFTHRSGGWARCIREQAEKKKLPRDEAEQDLRKERELEVQAIVSWISAGANAQDYAAHALSEELAAALGETPNDQFFTRDADAKRTTANVQAIIDTRCARCHAGGKSGPEGAIHLDTVEGVRDYCAPEKTGGGMSLTKLAQSTHVHLLGFSMLYGLTGFIFACTSYPLWVRCLLAPWPLVAQLADIGCWWLGRFDPWFAQAIMVTGGFVAVGLLSQILGSLFNLFGRAGRVALVFLIVLVGGAGAVLQTKVIGPYLAGEKVGSRQ
jgi:hypothetical protein